VVVAGLLDQLLLMKVVMLIRADQVIIYPNSICLIVTVPVTAAMEVGLSFTLQDFHKNPAILM
jgi:hypothetical protein